MKGSSIPRRQALVVCRGGHPLWTGLSWTPCNCCAQLSYLIQPPLVPWRPWVELTWVVPIAAWTSTFTALRLVQLVKLGCGITVSLRNVSLDNVWFVFCKRVTCSWSDTDCEVLMEDGLRFTFLEPPSRGWVDNTRRLCPFEIRQSVCLHNVYCQDFLGVGGL